MKRKNIFMLLAMVTVVLITMLLPDIQHALIESFENSDGVMLATAAVPVLNPLKWPQGKNNMAGYKPRLLFIPEQAVTAMPAVAYDSDKKTYVAAGSFTFATGTDDLTKPLYLYSTDGKVGHSAEPQGETDGISYKQKVEFFFPGNLPEMHLFNAMVKNTRGYYVIEDVDGVQYLVGEEGLPCTTSPAFDGGKARSDARGTAYSVECDSNYTAVQLGTPIDMQVVGGYKVAPEAGG